MHWLVSVNGMIFGSLLHQHLSEKQEKESPQLGHTFILSTGWVSIRQLFE